MISPPTIKNYIVLYTANTELIRDKVISLIENYYDIYTYADTTKPLVNNVLVSSQGDLGKYLTGKINVIHYIHPVNDFMNSVDNPTAFIDNLVKSYDITRMHIIYDTNEKIDCYDNGIDFITAIYKELNIQ
jgi:hypothetical protein